MLGIAWGAGFKYGKKSRCPEIVHIVHTVDTTYVYDTIPKYILSDTVVIPADVIYNTEYTVCDIITV